MLLSLRCLSCLTATASTVMSRRKLTIARTFHAASAVLTNTRTGSAGLVDLAFEIAEPFMARRLGL